jgi:isopentenyl-diphosphate delta-isomerase
MSELLVLVDEHDTPIGEMEKLEAHQKGLLHRAISVFIFNSKGELMLQQRAAEKYHSALLWTNTCCSHQRPGEASIDAAHRRLKEEMGFDCPLEAIGAMTYRVEFQNGLTEHE